MKTSGARTNSTEPRSWQHLVENVVILLRGRRGVEQIRAAHFIQ